jgi:uncharacterized protein YndB with AHSA1/START domain
VSAQEITITRVYRAPRELVWKAWTAPDRIARWWGARGWSTPPGNVTLDVRPGGPLRITSVSDDDGSEMTTSAVFREVVEPERLVLDEPAEGAWHEGAVCEVTFTDLGDGRTEMVFRATIDTTDEARRQAEAGLSSAFDRLAEILVQEVRS